MVHCFFGRIQDHRNNHLYCNRPALRQPTAVALLSHVMWDLGALGATAQQCPKPETHYVLIDSS